MRGEPLSSRVLVLQLITTLFQNEGRRIGRFETFILGVHAG